MQGFANLINPNFIHNGTMLTNEMFKLGMCTILDRKINLI